MKVDRREDFTKKSLKGKVNRKRGKSGDGRGK